MSCDNLRCDGNGWPPSTRAVLYQRTPPSGLWLAAGGTECVPHCSNPQYLVSLALWHSRGVNHATKSVPSLTKDVDSISRGTQFPRFFLPNGRASAQFLADFR